MHRRVLLKNMSILLGAAVSGACQQALQVPAFNRVVESPGYDRNDAEIAHRVMDLIIPATDTPGALAAGVGQFIDYVVAQWYDPEERQVFVEGLRSLDQNAESEFGSSFIKLPEAAQVTLLGRAEQAALAVQDKDGVNAHKAHFFTQIKELTVVGYYTSEIGATQELSYLPMPGRYDGYYKFSQVGRQWSS